MTTKEPRKGDVCQCCHKDRLVVVNRALVCTFCDSVHAWPVVKRGEA